MLQHPRLTLAFALGAISALQACQPVPQSETDALQRAVVPPIQLPIRVMPDTQEGFTDDSYEVVHHFQINLSQMALIEQYGADLFIQGHRLGYRDGHTAPDGKARVQLNGGHRVVLTNDHTAIDIFEPESLYGGIGGGFNTVRMTIDGDALCCVALKDCLSPGLNAFTFGFEGTDGASSGYRILDVNIVLRDGAQTPVLPSTDFVQEDPALWSAPSTAPADIANGESYFTDRDTLLDPASGTIMVAACSDCHASDGRDLEYFAYSNESIISRAVFHGLTQSQGQDIASYIRSHAAPRLGRPWNPPYQPGAGMDALGAVGWAAGAGLGAVLDKESDGSVMFNQLFPGGTSAADIEALIEGEGLPAATINLRELPIAIQLPDWNAWLPEIHPLDIWGEDSVWTDGVDLEAADYRCHAATALCNHPQDIHDTVSDALAAGPAPTSIPAILGILDASARSFIETGSLQYEGLAGWRKDGSFVLKEGVARGYSPELIKASMARWVGVRYWELMRVHGLENQGREVLDESLYGPWPEPLASQPSLEFGEVLSWPMGGSQAVHQIAPHILSDNNNNFQTPENHTEPGNFTWLCPDVFEKGCLDQSAAALPPLICNGGSCTIGECACDGATEMPTTHNAQTALKGDYDSTAWYHLQLILHAGARSLDHDVASRPLDHGYALRHIDEANRRAAAEADAMGVEAPWEGLRYAATLIKLAQMRKNDKGPTAKTGWAMRDVSPRLLVSNFNGYDTKVELLESLDTVEPTAPDLRLMFSEGYLRFFMATSEQFPALEWLRCDGCNERQSWFAIDPNTYTVTAAAGGQVFSTSHYHHADDIYRAIPILQALGLDNALTDELAVWGEEMWPGEVGSENVWSF